MGEPRNNVIDGRRQAARSGKVFFSPNPGRPEERLGPFPDSDERDVGVAVTAARRARDEWCRRADTRRRALLWDAAARLEASSGEWAELLIRDAGRVAREAREEVAATVTALREIAETDARLTGMAPVTVGGRDRRRMQVLRRVPRGVVAVVTSGVAALEAPAVRLGAALMAGNTVVVKPSASAPAPADRLVALLEEAGLASGVVNLVHGSGQGAGAPLVAHPDVDAVAFAGSSSVGRAIGRVCGAAGKPAALALDGNNTQLVLEDADLESALAGALQGAFAAAGQARFATGRLILHRRPARDFLGALTEAVRALKTGPAEDEATQIGPLLNDRRPPIVRSVVRETLASGAEDLTGAAGLESTQGSFVRPILLGNVSPSSDISRRAVPGPVLAVTIVDSLEEAIHVLRECPDRVSSSVYTRDLDRALRAAQEIPSEYVVVNGPTDEAASLAGITAAEAGPFAGRKIICLGFGKLPRECPGDSLLESEFN